jgi:hypothetical protein
MSRLGFASTPRLSWFRHAKIFSAIAPSNSAFKPTAEEEFRFNQPPMAGGVLVRR